MVSEALDAIPEELGELMSNVAVTVQHVSAPAGLLGLYQGVPLTRRSTFYVVALPDRFGGRIREGFAIVLPHDGHATYDQGPRDATAVADEVEGHLPECGVTVLPASHVQFGR